MLNFEFLNSVFLHFEFEIAITSSNRSRISWSFCIFLINFSLSSISALSIVIMNDTEAFLIVSCSSLILLNIVSSRSDKFIIRKGIFSKKLSQSFRIFFQSFFTPSIAEASNVAENWRFFLLARRRVYFWSKNAFLPKSNCICKALHKGRYTTENLRALLSLSH